MKANVNLMYKNTAQNSDNIHKTSKKRVKTRRLMSLFLTLSMVVSFFVLPQIPASAAALSGSGTKADPFIIATSADLTTLANAVNNSGETMSGLYFKQTNNITTNTGFQPIGKTGRKFRGYYDGQMNTITHTASYSRSDVGVFGIISGSAVVKNLYVKGTLTTSGTGNSSVGGVVGYADENSKILNCQFSGKINSSNIYTGGIVGAAANNVMIEFCETDNATVCSTKSNVGGIIGWAAGGVQINFCETTGGKVFFDSLTETNVGGIVGWANTSGGVRYCYNYATVQGTGGNGGSNAGGIVGLQENCVILYSFNRGQVTMYGTAGGIAGEMKGTSRIESCYNTGSVGAYGNAGGIVGDFSATVSSTSYNIAHCYNVGELSAGITYAMGGLIGMNHSGNYTNLIFYTGDTSLGAIGSPNGPTGVIKSASNAKKAASRDELNTWGNDKNGFTMQYYPSDETSYAYPMLSMNGDVPLHVDLSSGAVTAETTYTGKDVFLLDWPTSYIAHSTDGESWACSMIYGTNAGEYPIYARVSNGAKDYDNHYTCYRRTVPERVGTITIKKVTPKATITQAPRTYNEKAQDLISTATTNFGTIYYYSNTTGTAPASTTTGSTTKPSATNAGEYHIWYRIAGDSNVNSVGWTKLGTVTISEASAYPSVTLNNSWTYDGKSKSLVDQYGKTLSPSGKDTGKIYFYSNTTGTAPTAATVGSTNCPHGEDVGTYYVWYRFEAVDNYEDVAWTKKGTVKVSKVTPTVTATIQDNWTYDGTQKALLKTGTTDFGQICFYTNTSGIAPASSVTGSTIIPKVASANTHHVWYKVVGDTNVTSIGWTKVGAVTVSALKRTITLSKTSYTKTLSETAANNTFALGATANNGTLTYESSDPTRVTVDANGNATVKKPGNATITVTLAGDANHTSDQKTIAISINGTVPGAASNFSARSGQNNKIDLSWIAPAFNGGYALTGYTIMRKATNESAFKSIASVSDLDTTYTDTTAVNGTDYTYRLYAKNSEGTASKYAEASGRPFTTSGPVDSLTGSVENKRLAFWWYIPQESGGVPPVNYNIKITRGDGSQYLSNDTGTRNGIEVTADFTQIFNPGEKLTAVVIPYNYAGAGPSSSYTLTLPNIPGVPKDFRTSPDASGTIAAYWSEGDTDNYPITKYTVSYRKHGSGEEFTNVELTDLAAIRDMVEEGSESVIGSKKYKYVITGLETGVVYDVKVTASNLGYTSETTKVLEQICAGRPSAPVIDGDMITKDQGVFAKAVSAEPNGGDITEYVFYARLTEDGAEAPFTEFARVAPGRDGNLTNVYAKGNLVNGKNYDVCVSAVNIAGESAKSEPQTLIVGYPSIVQNIHITPKAGSVMNITFDPSDGNGRPIDHYELMIGGTVNGKTQEVVTIKTNAEETKNTTYDFFSGERVNGDEITVQIVAVTKFSLTQEGKSEPSEKLTARIGAPSAPILTRDETDETGVAIAWAESSANGNAMKYYTVYIADISSADNTTVTRFKTANADAESLEMVVAKGEIDTTDAVDTFDNSGEKIQLLTKYKYPFVDGHKYSVTVTATNAAGESDASNAGVFTFAAPAEPQDVVVTPEDGKLTVSWSKPLNDGGYKIVGYNIYLNEDKDPTMKVEWVKTINGVEAADDAEPAEGEAVKYQLKATDYRKGSGAASENYGDGQDNIDRFEVVIGDLANGYSYTATVKAINESGEGAGSNNTEPETPRTKASAPLNIEGKGASGTSIDVSWRKPLSDGGTPINGYNVRAYAVSKKNMETGEYENIEPEVDAEGNKIVAAEMTDVIGTSCTVKGLKTEYGYVFDVCAVTSAGEGAIGTSKTATTHTKPSKPSIISLDSGVGSGETLPLTVTWAAPEDDGNSPIIGYDVLVGGFPMNKDGMLSPDELTWTFEDNRVKSGKTYKVTVKAYNAVDVEGVESDPMSIKVGTVPAPKNVQLSGDTDGNIFITWPIDQYKDVMSYIEKYVVYVDGEMFASTANNRDNHMTAELQDLGVKHKVEVAVLSKMGEGNKSIPVYITLGTTNQIQNVSAVAGKQSIKLTWDKPVVQTTSLRPSEYTVYANDKLIKTIEAAELDAADPKVKTELTNLEGGKEYTITVTATNRHGESVPSEAVKVQPWADPDTPRVDNIKPALGEFSFTFEDGSGRGASITDHNIYLDGNKLEASAYTIDGNKVTVKNVTDGGTGHKFYITAITVINGGTCESAKPDSEYTVITGVPLVPDNVQAIAGVSSATIAFDKSEDISAEHPVTKYNIYKIENGVETLLTSVSSRDENNNISERYSYTVNGLTNGTEYSFSVSALNDLGESEHCGVSVKPGTPTAPKIESVTPSSGKLEVKWSEPEKSNAGAITKYGVYLNGVLAKTTPETSMLIGDLENGSEYVITVSAFNYVGEGEKSNSVTATPGGPPDKISGIDYELTYNETDKCGVELTWKAPEDTGGLDITGYKVIGEGNIAITGRKAVITGLERGTDYTWDIIACSAAGDSNAVTTDTITTLDKPGAPKLVGVDSSNSEFTLTWEAPLNDGASRITSYNFYFKPVDGGEEIVWTLTTIPDPDKNGEMSASVNTDVLTDLVVGQKYEITATAINVVDESDRSTSTRTTLNDALEQKIPGAPTNVKASKGDTKITLSWAAPLSDGNSTITSYVIWTGTSEDNLGYLATVNGHTFSYEHTGLPNGTERFYKVKAVNGVDADGGPFSEVVSETPVKINAPTKPAWVTFNDAEGKSAYETSASGDTMTFRWNESTGDELGGAISYEVYINGTLMYTTDGLEYVLSSPANNTRYNVQIKAVNAVGGEALSDYLYAYKNLNIRKGRAEDGYEYDEYYNDNVFAYIDADYDGEEDYKPTYTKPNPPENVELKQSKTEPSAILTWEPPTETGNKEINGYKAYITFNGETEIVQLDANGNVENNHSLFSLFSADDTSAHNDDSLYEYVFGITYGKAYTVQMKAVNEVGESDPSSPATLYSFPETPSAFSAAVENKSNIALEWQLVSEPRSFTLYVNGKPQTEIAMADVTATKDAASEFTTYRYTYPAELNETYFFEIVANFIDADNNEVPSGRSDGCEISTKEAQANAPAIISARANGDAVNDMYRVTLEWTAPDNINDADVDADSYAVYVNGQEYTGRFYVNGAEANKIPADATSVDIEGIYNKSLIKIAAVSASGTVGIVSEPMTFNAVEQTFEVGTPGQPTNFTYELQMADGILLNRDNLVLNWKSAVVSSEHNVKASRFDIYSGIDTEPICAVDANPADADDVQYDYTCTLTVEAGKDYNIRIVPVYVDGTDKVGPEASEVIRVPGYPEPSKPTLTAELSSDKKTISLTWDANELSGVKYTITVNGVDVAENIEGTSYTYTVEENVTDYVISVTAVRDYELSDGSIETTTAKSNSEKVTVQNGSGGGETGDGNTNSNPPVITKTLSNGGVGGNGIKVKVYWNAPADKLQNEVGEIYKYVVVANDQTIGTVLAKGDDGTDNPLEYEITTFKTLTETKNVVIRAIKEINGQDVISATSKAWIVSPKYNVQNDKDKYDNDDDTDVEHKNTTGEDKEDEEKQQITLPILANVKGNVKVTIKDNFDKTVEIGTELGEDGSGTVNINDADVKDPNKTFSITLSKECCTTYTITGLTYADLTSAKLEELMNSVELYVGDFNGDGAVTNADRAIINRNMNKTGMTLADGDFNGDGVVTNNDRAMFNASVNKVSIEIPFSK